MIGFLLGLSAISALESADTRLTSSEDCIGMTAEARALERVWLDAYEARDVDRMDEILADDFIIVHPNANVQSKRAVLSSLRRRAGTPGPRFVTSYVSGRCYADIVILSGWVSEIGDDDPPSRYTDVYVRSGAKWRVTSSHLSRRGASAISAVRQETQ